MSESHTPAIRAEGLVKVYRGRGRRPEVRALDGLTFSVPPGRVFGLLGPNGAGKWRRPTASPPCRSSG